MLSVSAALLSRFLKEDIGILAPVVSPKAPALALKMVTSAWLLTPPDTTPRPVPFPPKSPVAVLIKPWAETSGAPMSKPKVRKGVYMLNE
jgi:hypothetical protein